MTEQRIDLLLEAYAEAIPRARMSDLPEDRETWDLHTNQRVP